MASTEVYMVIDIGTGNIRVAVVDTCGNIIAVKRADIIYHKDDHYPDSLYFEPAQLWKQVTGLAVMALKISGDVQVIALTATSQREGIVLIDGDGNSLVGLPNIDHRGRQWEHIISDKDAMFKLAGRYPTSLFSAMKLVGIREKRNELWQACASFMSISDWAEYMLSGIIHYEHSQASETLLYDVQQKNWSAILCQVFDLQSMDLPPLKQSGTVLGKIKPGQADNFNISKEALVLVGGADTQLAVVSTQPEMDDIVIVSGTTTPIIKLTQAYVIDDKERTWTGRHVTEFGFMLEANAGVTGLNYQRLKEIFYPREAYHIIEEELSRITTVHCFASLGSLIAEEETPLLKGGFIIDAPVSHLLSRAGFVWATLWDMACCIFENYTTLCEVSPHTKNYVWGCGGGLQSVTLRRLLASLMDKEVWIRNNYQDASVIGGAIICNKALGKNPDFRATVEAIEPGTLHNHAELYRKWKETRLSFKSIIT
jgi:autoinducer 2 (AI-2) kinase